MKNLVKYLTPYKKEIILGPFFKTLEAIFELLVPLVMAKIIDIGLKDNNLPYIIKMGIVIVILGFIGLICALTCQYFASKASQGFGTLVRSALFKHINTLSHKELDKIGTSSLITRMTTDINQLQVAVAMAIRLAIRAPLIILGSIFMASLIDLKLSVIFLISTPLIALVLFMVMSRSIPFYSLIQRKLDNLSLIVRENLEGVRVIRAFSKQKKEKERFINTVNSFTESSITVGKISALLNPLSSLIMNFSIIAILWYGGIRVDIGDITQGEIIAFVNYITQILLTLIVAANLVVIFNKAYASAIRVNEIFSFSSSIKEPDLSALNVNKNYVPKIEFKNVYFSYTESNNYALSNISLKINKGETIGIIGGTGSGKSTLANLIPRFYDVSKGEVLVDGLNVKNYTFKSLRRKIGLVPQKAILFSGTIKENMKWGLEGASDSEIEKALEIAQATDFVNNFPNKYETLILQNGKNLSGGQRQRLTIARALINNPEILILDDSTSALDYLTTFNFQKELKNQAKNTTVIMISQRINSIRNADKILVLDEGKAVGIGTHEYLIKNCNVYKEICLSQLSKEEVEN